MMRHPSVGWFAAVLLGAPFQGRAQTSEPASTESTEAAPTAAANPADPAAAIAPEAGSTAPSDSVSEPASTHPGLAPLGDLNDLLGSDAMEGPTTFPEELDAGPSDGPAAVELTWNGHVRTETHYRVQRLTVGSFFNQVDLPASFARNENTLNLKLRAKTGRYNAVAELELDWLGTTGTPAGLAELTHPEAVSPYRLQAHALYLEASDLFIDGLYLRLGQQTINWGVADQFNPTNTINPPDLENVLFFGRQVANVMARVDYSLWEMWTLSGVFVPVFKPALLPPTAPLALASTERLPMIEDRLRWRLESERDFALRLQGSETATVVSAISPVMPEPRLTNGQYAFRLAGTLLEQDVAISYYNGRTPFPVPVINRVSQRDEQVCDPNDPNECVESFLETETMLRFPRMQVVGFNLAGEVNLLGWLSDSIRPLGYRVEAGLYLPQARAFRIFQDELAVGGFPQPAGEYDYDLAGGRRPLVVESTPFAKWVVGLDYSFGRVAYVNVMWVHGLVDEYGAGDFLSEGLAVRASGVEGSPSACVLTRNGETCAYELLRPRLGDYLVVGVDLKFADERGLFRLFTIWDLGGIYREAYDPTNRERVRTHESFYSADGLSAVIYPELGYNFDNGLGLIVGGFVQLGEAHTKFGDPAAGGSMVWTRGTYAF